MKVLLVLVAILTISFANPVEDTSRLISIFKGVFEHADEIELTDDNEELKKSDRECVWQKLRLENSATVEAAEIPSFDEFKVKSAENRKVLRAAHQAAFLCQTDDEKLNDFKDVAIFLGAFRFLVGRTDLDVGCIKQQLKKIDPNSPLLANFSTEKSDEECANVISKHDDSDSSSSSEENENEFADLEIRSCTAGQYNGDKENERMRLISALASHTDTKVNEDGQIANVMKEIFDEITKQQLNCILEDLGVE